MFSINLNHLSRTILAGVALLGSAFPCIAQPDDQTQPNATISVRDLGKQLEVGDVVFIRIPLKLFTKVASSTSSWTNHVGVVTSVSGDEPVISESRVPFSGETTWSAFVKRSDMGRVAVKRMAVPLSPQQEVKLRRATIVRNGILYDTGFDLHSKKQFCSRYVREAMHEAVGVELGEVENFTTLLKNNPQADQDFWRVWYFGNIPWQRETVTPASLLRDRRLHDVFDGYAR